MKSSITVVIEMTYYAEVTEYWKYKIKVFFAIKVDSFIMNPNVYSFFDRSYWTKRRDTTMQKMNNNNCTMSIFS